MQVTSKVKKCVQNNVNTCWTDYLFRHANSCWDKSTFFLFSSGYNIVEIVSDIRWAEVQKIIYLEKRNLFALQKSATLEKLFNH